MKTLTHGCETSEPCCPIDDIDLAAGGAMLTLGEVHTGFLRNSTSVSGDRMSRVLALAQGERVRRSERPMPYAISPERLRGIDCVLVAASGARHRTIGTVATHAAITGGHVLQGSAFTRIVGSESKRRLPWPHYLSRPGVVEIVGKIDWADLVAGFLSESHSRDAMDLGAICAEVMHLVQTSSDLDQITPMRTARARLRWAALDQDGDRRVHFAIEQGGLRTLRIPGDHGDPGALAEICADLAMHDWLLTSLESLIERSDIGAVSRTQIVRRFRPAIDYLLHLWMPAARVDQSVWDALERNPGFTRHWEALVNRIRDQLAAATVALLGESLTEMSDR
ncbi:SCO2521 family protein [Phytohabitans sp. ZYX-F-186]|uniref:SCO2521 family protein n=1 Tax=Phytohabitans maris TaxID=3071409 RepID=A0ABU0ZD57_9ACTN|nr:SCO2521 family protein [Phytohabitans sp. ZYX-F-186]MDQ7904277.1 SCO2521 family protein [Phytohabitans sp. ZYX-F-186]